MELFERIRYLSEIKNISLSKLAKGIGVPQQTFHQWLKPGSQKNLWEHLPDILELYPDVRKEWLYFDDLPALHNGTGPVTTKENIELVEAREKIQNLENELREANRLNRQLTTKLLIDGIGDKNAVTNTGAVGGEGG